MPFHGCRLILTNKLNDLLDTVINVTFLTFNRNTPLIKSLRQLIFSGDINVNTVIVFHIFDALTTLANDSSSRGVRND